jgi:hypothetical protein
MKDLIYVELLDEGIEVWRPVHAERIRDGVFRILDVAPPDEQWKYPSGSVVHCVPKELSSGVCLVASSYARPVPNPSFERTR